MFSVIAVPGLLLPTIRSLAVNVVVDFGLFADLLREFLFLSEKGPRKRNGIAQVLTIFIANFWYVLRDSGAWPPATDNQEPSRLRRCRLWPFRGFVARIPFCFPKRALEKRTELPKCGQSSVPTFGMFSAIAVPGLLQPRIMSLTACVLVDYEILADLKREMLFS